VINLVFAILGFLPILILLFVIIGVSKAKNTQSEKEGENMFKQLYVYLVMFTMLLLSVGGGIGIFTGVADLVNPTSYTGSYTDYKNTQLTYDEKGNEIPSKKTEEQLRKDYEAQIKFDKEQTKNEAKNTIIDSVGFIVIPFPIFLFFNRMRKKKVNE
jgi:hypothetical protein